MQRRTIAFLATLAVCASQGLPTAKSPEAAGFLPPPLETDRPGLSVYFRIAREMVYQALIH